jgi:hypothetical protein
MSWSSSTSGILMFSVFDMPATRQVCVAFLSCCCGSLPNKAAQVWCVCVPHLGRLVGTGVRVGDWATSEWQFRSAIVLESGTTNTPAKQLFPSRRPTTLRASPGLCDQHAHPFAAHQSFLREIEPLGSWDRAEQKHRFPKSPPNHSTSRELVLVVRDFETKHQHTAEQDQHQEANRKAHKVRFQIEA